MLGNAVFRLLLRLRLPQPAAAGTAAVLMGVYCLFAGGQAAAVRAFIMFSAMLGARLLKRSYDLLSALALAAILLLLAHPGYLFYSGFQLSFAAVLGIGTVWPLFRRLLKRSVERRKKGRKKFREKLFRGIAEGSASWAAVTLTTQPLVCFWFYEIPVLSLPVNLLMLPAMNLVMVSGMAGGMAALLCPALGKLLAFPAELCLKGYRLLTGAVRRIPGAVWICGQPELWQILLFYAGLAAALLLLNRGLMLRGKKEGPGAEEKRNRPGPEGKKTAMAAAVLLALSCAVLFWRESPEFSLTALDVGQGDCLVLNRGGKTCFLVDGGSSSEKQAGRYRILPYLKQQGIGRLEGIFVSHPDRDHLNGILEILEMTATGETALEVGRLFLPEWMKGEPEDREVRERAERAGIPVFYLASGDSLTADGLHIRVLYPSAGTEVTGNEGSMTLLAEYGKFRALLTGDLEGEGEEEAAKAAGKCTYLKVAHHGSAGSTSAAFLEQLSPCICLISAPEKSVYGHPAPEVLARIEEAGADWYQTGLAGAVTAEVCGERVKVYGYRGNIAFAEEVVYTEG
jgi:competence protein ComEC